MSFEPPSLGDLHSSDPHQFLPAQAILGQEIPKRLRRVADSVIAAELDESFLERLRLDDRGEVAGEFLDAGLGRTGGREGTKPGLCVVGCSPDALNEGTPKSAGACCPSGTAIGLARPDLTRSSTAGEATG